jgi:hypothetical protein
MILDDGLNQVFILEDKPLFKINYPIPKSAFDKVYDTFIAPMIALCIIFIPTIFIFLWLYKITGIIN